MTQPFTIRALRTEMGLTLDEFAKRIGVGSRGYASGIERGGPCSVRVALAIEALSDGRISAAQINADVALVESARADRDGSHAPTDSPAAVPASARNDADATPRSAAA